MGNRTRPPVEAQKGEWPLRSREICRWESRRAWAVISIVSSGWHLGLPEETGRRFLKRAEEMANPSGAQGTGLGPAQSVGLEREHEQLGEREEMKE